MYLFALPLALSTGYFFQLFHFPLNITLFLQYLQILKINLASNELGKLHLDFPKLVFDKRHPHHVDKSLDKIRQILETQDVVLLDYNLNPDNADKSKPLSHAELIKMYLEGRYPEDDLPVV